MLNAILRFVSGIFKMPLYAQLWVILLTAVNMVVPLFFLSNLAAKVVLTTSIVSVALMILLTAISGFSRLLGLGHFPWFPLLYFLWTRLDETPATDSFGIWIRVLIAMNAITLVIDVLDVVRYMSGDRKQML